MLILCSLAMPSPMENYEKFKEVCGDLIAGRTQLYGDIGCVVGAHAGPGIVGIAFIKKA